MTARRQRSTELTLEHQYLTLKHQREVAATAERDAAEQRITELYARAVDQLGNDKAPVRLGGLYALERLAQNNADQRQTIVDVVCAYLRMPYAPPEDKPPAEDAPAEAHVRYEQRRQELQVRMTAQRILAAHLRVDAGDSIWTDIDLDLTDAHLHWFDLSGCHIQTAQFRGAQFTGSADFHKAQFTGSAWFRRARFSGNAWFTKARFGGDAAFADAQFSGVAGFTHAQFTRAAWFDRTKFSEAARFCGAWCGGNAGFADVQFTGDAKFEQAQFSGDARFDGARVQPKRLHSCPAGWTTREARLAEGEEEGWMYLVRVEEMTE